MINSFLSLWKKLHFVSLVMLHTMPGFYHVNGVFIFEIVWNCNISGLLKVHFEKNILLRTVGQECEEMMGLPGLFGLWILASM